MTNWRNADLQYRRITNPIIIGNHIAVGDFDGYVHLLNLETGVVEGRAQITSDVPIGKNIHSVRDNKILGIDGSKMQMSTIQKECSSLTKNFFMKSNLKFFDKFGNNNPFSNLVSKLTFHALLPG